MENIPFEKHNPTNKWDCFRFSHLPHSFVELQSKAKQHIAQKLSVVLGISAKSAEQKSNSTFSWHLFLRRHLDVNRLQQRCFASGFEPSHIFNGVFVMKTPYGSAITIGLYISRAPDGWGWEPSGGGWLCGYGRSR